MLKNKEKAFTIIEVIAVISILTVIIAIFLPKIQGFFMEAKKVEVIDQARKIRMAVVTFEASNDKEFKDISVSGHINNTVGAVKNYQPTNKYFEGITIDKIPDSITLDDIYNIVENGADFNVNSSGVFDKFN
ncbi:MULTISPECIES: type II secretion system protein [Clostridium]|uniref:Prepilin-type N-terminal cleavage/methylation domain-containing protein n=1 Tax=Clostridium nitritogenes TaxID=83340 RepID=A0ABP3X7N4_9CLOT|nr:type II secretion system protein [Clostridium baratii]MBT9830789.1 prepilin-type N-terminal cleavage/methylation domain-containing protein [Clostridium baratii]MDY3208628.1 type II secretion system protein [Clostridium baratii]STB00754.1 pilin [Clostridium baratii]